LLTDRVYNAEYIMHESNIFAFCMSFALMIFFIAENPKLKQSGFGSLEVACWPLEPKFAGSNLAEAVGFFRVKKSSTRFP
jgi:hypothetical protein